MLSHRSVYWVGIVSLVLQIGYWTYGLLRQYDRMRGTLARDIAAALAPGYTPWSTLDTAMITCSLEIPWDMDEPGTESVLTVEPVQEVVAGYSGGIVKGGSETSAGWR